MWRSAVVLNVCCYYKRGTGALLPRFSLHTSPTCTKLSDFQVSKITHEFDNILDRNNDGFVDKVDIEALKRKLRDYANQWPGTRPSKPGEAPYKASYDDYWQLFQEIADTNKDGRLSREEWIELWTKISDNAKDTSFQSLPQWVQMMPGSLFQCMDYKGDGVIDREEYRNFWSHVAGYPVVSDTILKRYFDIMTEAGSLRMNLKRVEELYADFYLSSDPRTPGKYIAGPVEYT